MAKISVRVQPGASKNEILGFAEEVLRVRVMAPPNEGKANQALIAFLARALRIRRSAVQVIKGTTGRDKLLSIEGINDEELRRLLTELSAAGT